MTIYLWPAMCRRLKDPPPRRGCPRARHAGCARRAPAAAGRTELRLVVYEYTSDYRTLHTQVAAARLHARKLLAVGATVLLSEEPQPTRPSGSVLAVLGGATTPRARRSAQLVPLDRLSPIASALVACWVARSDLQVVAGLFRRDVPALQPLRKSPRLLRCEAPHAVRRHPHRLAGTRADAAGVSRHSSDGVSR